MIVLALLLAYAAAVADPCMGAPWPSLLHSCGPSVQDRRLNPPGLDAYLRSEFGVIGSVVRPPVVASVPAFVDPGPGPASVVDTVEALGGASCVVMGYGCR